ncbi:MAG: YciI family protein [Pseudomonadota bacterium]
MPHIVLFQDNPAADPDLRAQHMSDHLAFLQSHRDRILAAGPLFDGDAEGAGGLWIVSPDDPALIETLIRQDPFWQTGLRHTHQILRWHPVFANQHQLASLALAISPNLKE